MRRRPAAALPAVNAEHAGSVDLVAEEEVAVAPFADAAVHFQLVTEFRRRQEFGVGLGNRDADHAMLVENLRQWQAGIDEEMPGAGVEPGEIARVEYDPRRIGVAPLDPYTMNIGLHLP